MIDRKSRDKLAESIRFFAAGQITNDEFENSIPESDDEAIARIFHEGVWFLYDDLKEYKLIGKDQLSKADKSIIARWVLFLKTDFEYQWPSLGFKKWFINKITFGLVGQSELELCKEAGNLEVWPFLHGEQLQEAKQGYGYLGIKNT